MSAVSALARKCLWQTRNVWRIISAQSALKVVFVIVFATGFEAALWLLFLDGFKFLDSLGGAGIMIITRLFSLFFFGMGMMLVVSSVITSYSTMFRSGEIGFLVVRPFHVSDIVLYKFAESTFLSSWAFFFIVIPFIGSYAWHERLSVLFALWTLLFSLPFLVICSGLGAVLTVALVRWMPRGRWVKVIGAAAALLAVFLVWNFSMEVYDPSAELQFNLKRLAPGLSLASNALLPSWWVSEGIMALSREQWGRGAMLWVVVVSSAMLICVAVEWLGSAAFYQGWQRVIAGSGSTRRNPVLFPRLERFLSFLASDVRTLVLKDVRAFFRDPMQWSQVLVFFGLLALYFVNLRNFRYHVLPENWRNTIAFLNVFSVSSVMCSLSSRFIYPQLSLEGQGFWLLGMSPTTMKRILLAKFWLALAGMMTVSVSLMFLSAAMLNASWPSRLAAAGIAAATSLAVCAFSTGLGAVFLDLDQRNPAAIVSGFGGTLNLVLSLGFMLAAILPFGLVFHFNTIHRLTHAQFISGLFLSGAWLAAITVAATVIPLYLGWKSLARREF